MRAKEEERAIEEEGGGNERVRRKKRENERERERGDERCMYLSRESYSGTHANMHVGVRIRDAVHMHQHTRRERTSENIRAGARVRMCPRIRVVEHLVSG